MQGQKADFSPRPFPCAHPFAGEKDPPAENEEGGLFARRFQGNAVGREVFSAENAPPHNAK